MSAPAHPILEVYQTGPTTVVGFGGRDVLLDVNVAGCRDELLALIENEQCEVVAFDLTGVMLLPSGLLGVLASLRKLGVSVHLYNPSKDIREVLEITHLNRLMEVYEVPIQKD
ncbi:STAS domain-containing protein [Planctomicrobium sp. SH668]|uniref:STAS domain-containing protein n=1 Tax=Planctomicrobium sp. SH668 TaxID=3448126 RepID=UPI003F5C30A5